MSQPGVRISFEVNDLAQGKLNRLVETAGDLEPLMDEIGGSLVTSAQMRFERGQGPDGNDWVPSKRVELKGGKTLIESRRLFDSVTYRTTPSSVEIGTNAIHARVHQFGAVIKPKKAKALTFRTPDGSFVSVKSVEIPARPYLGFSEDDRREVTAIIEDYALAALGGGA